VVTIILLSPFYSRITEEELAVIKGSFAKLVDIESDKESTPKLGVISPVSNELTL